MKTTKKALFSSVVALVLCFSMFIGTTMAWFTDSVTSGVNQILAGNLDIEVSYKDGATWEPLQDATSLFSTQRWEPGHTEYVVLKVENKGTLGFNYKMMVSPISENGGINVAGNPFKLSNYLVFGTVASATEPSYTDRAAAREAVGTVMTLNQESLTKSGSILANGAAQYITLVVYMPESVGNEANYKTGTAAPSIELGIKVLATQLTAENDSFGPDYDDEAVNTPFYTAGAYYDYFEAVNISGTADEDGNFTVEKTDASSGVIASASGTAAAGAQVNLLVVKSSEAEQNFTIRVDEGHELNGYDIKVSGQADGSLVQGKLYVGTGLENFKFYHNNVEMEAVAEGNLTNGQYRYNPADGFVYFASTTFSPFQATYKAPVAAINTAVYGTLADAIAAAKAGDTVTLLKNAAGNGIVIPSGSNLTVDFNGYTYDVNGELVGSSGTETNSLQLLKDSTITFKNGTLTSTQSRYVSQILIQNYANLTLDNMTVSAGIPFDYIVSNNNGNVVIKNTTINAAAGKVAFDVCRYASYTGPSVTVEGNSVINGNVEISSSGAQEGAVHKLTVTGGTFNGEFVMYSSPDFVGNITGGTFATDVNTFCAEGYGALKDGNQYKVIAGNFAKDAASLKAMLAEGGTVYLTKNISLGSSYAPLTVNKDAVLEGNGYKVSASRKNVFQVTGKVDFTMRNVSISVYNNNGVEATTSAGSKLTFENVSIKNTFKALHFNDCRDTAVTIKGCTLTSTYPFNVNGGSISSFVVEDTTLNGWTSFSKQKDNGTYQFKNCSFGMGNGYATVKPYGNTVFENCTFSADYFASLEGGIASGTTTPITVNFNSCKMITSDGVTEALTVDLLKTAFNYNITSGSNSGDSTINEQYWYVNGEQLAFATGAE